MRVAVAGAGVIGASVAWNLVCRGQEVVLIDRGRPGRQVSRWTFSWVNASSKAGDRRQYYELCNAGIGAHVELAAELGAGAGNGGWLHRNGHFRSSDDDDELVARADQLAAWGHDVGIWTADRVRRLLEPSVRLPDGARVLVCRDEGWLDGPALVDRLVADAGDRGGRDGFTCLETAVTAIGVSGGRVTEVELAGGGRAGVDAVVNAAGPAAPLVARMVGRDLALRDDPGLVVRLVCDPVPIRRVLYLPGIELRPDGPGRVVAHSPVVDASLDPGTGATIEPGFEATAVPDQLVADVRRRALDAVPELADATVAGAAIARRPVPLDGYPVVGAVDGVPGYYEAVTHSGITLAALIGRLLAAEIVDGVVDDRMVAYRPGRFGLGGGYVAGTTSESDVGD